MDAGCDDGANEETEILVCKNAHKSKVVAFMKTRKNSFLLLTDLLSRL